MFDYICQYNYLLSITLYSVFLNKLHMQYGTREAERRAQAELNKLHMQYGTIH